VRLEGLGKLKKIHLIRDSNRFIYFLIRIVGGGVHIGCPRGTVAMYWPIAPVPGDCEYGEVGGMKCGWLGKPKYSEKTCPGAIFYMPAAVHVYFNLKEWIYIQSV
jgi:hypothetical protein